MRYRKTTHGIQGSVKHDDHDKQASKQ